MKLIKDSSLSMGDALKQLMELRVRANPPPFPWPLPHCSAQARTAAASLSISIGISAATALSFSIWMSLARLQPSRLHFRRMQHVPENSPAAIDGPSSLPFASAAFPSPILWTNSCSTGASGIPTRAASSLPHVSLNRPLF